MKPKKKGTGGPGSTNDKLEVPARSQRKGKWLGTREKSRGEREWAEWGGVRQKDNQRSSLRKRGVLTSEKKGEKKKPFSNGQPQNQPARMAKRS